MGIYDREYYRNSRGGFLGSFTGTGQVCKWLILINVGMFLLQIFTPARPVPGWNADSQGLVTDLFMLDSQLIFSGQVWRLLSYAFLHSPHEILHIVFNMLFLYWFGRELEDMYGSLEFLCFYLVAALLGGVAFTAYAGYSSWQMTGSIAGDTMRYVGASGAVTAVMLLYACHFPHRTILLFFILPVPIWLFVGFQVIQDSFWFAQGLSNPRGVRTTTAVACHLGGALFGFLYYRLGWRVSSLASDWNLRLPRRSRPRLRIYEEEALVSSPVSAQKTVDEQFEAKLDAVLQKIQTHGKDSLTESERQVLLRASEIYKQRRQSTEGV